MLADACTIACSKIFDTTRNEWVDNGDCWPTLFISTEVEVDELQTMALAFLTGINEERILKHEIDFTDTRLTEAVEILKKAPLYIEVLPDFTVKDVENTIKRNIRVNGVTHVFFDYINSSLGLLTEIAQQVHGVAMREDNILFLLSTRLKEIAVDFNVFIMSATQTNASFKTDPIPDATLLKGSKAIAEKVDWGGIFLPVTEEDKAGLRPLIAKGLPQPNMKLSVYKNRRGSFTRGYVWLLADKGTCRYEQVFVTDWDYSYNKEISEHPETIQTLPYSEGVM